MNSAEHRLVLVRHGDSIWNLGHRFTGWIDIPLSDQGKVQAAAAGKQLAALGIRFNEVHTSVMLRTHQTADYLLSAAKHAPIPRFTHWRLNERHYGQLQGLNKREIFAIWGEDKSRRWWRGYQEPPPPMNLSDPRHPRFDSLYDDIDPDVLPASESLLDCQCRLLPYWREILAPRLAAGVKLLVISHGNALRGLVMHLENITPVAIEHLEIPACVPLLYRFDDDLKLLGRDWLS
ncbi:MAG: 2,3-bisphosphoglycerate-dependent phosphoglycerate mutase [Gallionella sp.]